MSDIKLFRTAGKAVVEIPGHGVALERSLQTLIEQHLETFLGVRFLATEHSTGKTHAGRIDTLGIDEDNCPCIIECKRSSNENVINQGLFYLDWLLDHKGEFELLVMKMVGQEVASRIEWLNPRLICIAGDFTRYDEHAVQQINRNIELYRYQRFGDELLLLELVNSVQARGELGSKDVGNQKASKDKTVDENLATASTELLDLMEELRSTLRSFGDDVIEKRLKLYIAFKRIKNFASVEVISRQAKLLVYVKVNPDEIAIEEGFTRDVRAIGHWGTGDLSITLRSSADLQKALPLLQRSYDNS